MPITVRPTKLDITIAAAIARYTRPFPERVSQVATWGADEHTLCALAAGLARCGRMTGLTLVSTRVLLLAHWTSDVLAGLAIGLSLERLLRNLTRYGNSKLGT